MDKKFIAHICTEIIMFITVIVFFFRKKNELESKIIKLESQLAIVINNMNVLHTMVQNISSVQHNTNAQISKESTKCNVMEEKILESSFNHLGESIKSEDSSDEMDDSKLDDEIADELKELQK